MKEHFVIEQIMFKRNALSHKNGKREVQSAEMHVCVGWCVKWNSLWRYTTLSSYNFIEWMISMIVTVRLWRHSKYCTNQTGSMYKNRFVNIFRMYLYFVSNIQKKAYGCQTNWPLSFFVSNCDSAKEKFCDEGLNFPHVIRTTR